jgi:hypothetical protein
MLVNLWLKINAKLGGTTCALDTTVKSPILQRPVVIFGMVYILKLFLLGQVKLSGIKLNK